MSDMKTAALRIAELGYRVFPLVEGGKRPDGRLAPHGVKDATDDRGRIASWWTASPKANIGLACGNGLLVVDIDKPLRLLELPATAERRTPRGRHLFYRTAEKHGNSAGKLEEGVDTRGEGGYVVAGGTVNGVEYGFARNPPEPWSLAVFPEALAKRLRQAGAREDGTARGTREAASRLVEQWPPAISGVNGNDTTYRLCCALRNLGRSREEAGFDILSSRWNAGLNEPWNAAELMEGPLSSAWKYSRTATGEGAEDMFGAPEEAGGKQEKRAKEEERFRLFDTEEIERRPPVEWLVEHTIPAGSMSMIYGPPGAGKSFIALDICGRLACGLPWGGHAARAARVLYVAGEGVAGLAARVRAMKANLLAEGWRDGGRKGRDAVGEALARNLRFMLEMPPASDSEAVAAFTARVEGKRFKLMVFDTFWRLNAGFEENSSRETGLTLRTVERAAGGASVMLVHHSAKSGGARGSAALTAAMDAVIAVEAEEGVIETRMEKQKDAEGWPAKSWTLQTEEDSAFPVEGGMRRSELQKKTRIGEAVKTLREAEGPIALRALARAVAEATTDSASTADAVEAGVRADLREWAAGEGAAWVLDRRTMVFRQP